MPSGSHPHFADVVIEACERNGNKLPVAAASDAQRDRRRSSVVGDRPGRRSIQRALKVLKTWRRPAKAAPPQGVYVGIEIETRHRPSFAIYVHDGFYGIDFTVQTMVSEDGRFSERPECDLDECVLNGCKCLNTDEASVDDASAISGSTIEESSPDEEGPYPLTEEVLKNLEQRIIDWLRNYARAQRYKIFAAGIGITEGADLAVTFGDSFMKTENGQMRLRLPARLWFELDILPVIVETRGWSIDERACSGARKAQLFLVQNNIPRIASGYRHRVEVDGNGRIHMCDAIDYEKTVSPQTWGVLQQLVRLTVERDLRITFFSSTPQGGGVALMRHALIRILHLMGVEAQWYVMKPKPEVFDITKRKFHNVLQGVAGPDVHLNDHDKRMYEHWCKDNITRYWTEGPIVQSDVIIIDDPQPAGLIRYIKHLNPRCKIIYRSHIEVRSDLADNPETEQHHVWNYLWQFIQHADLFISHPVANFVPSNVPRDRLLMLPAATDPLDGLNKELDPASTMYYHAVFNRLSIDTTGRHIDFARPYIIQIARFDPSKGIPDVLKAFRLLRRRMEGEGCSEHELPQLVLCGHGSIDDPDGNLVFEQVLSILEEDQYLSVLDDIAVVRLPPSDQLLDTLMRGAKVALQLSTREGFEIKVTEALAKGRPVVAYAAGGIPHQIHDGCNGYLVKIGDVDTVVQRLYELLTDDKLYRKMSRAAVKYVSEEYFTVYQAINWLWLCNAVHSGRFSGQNPNPDDAMINQEEGALQTETDGELSAEDLELKRNFEKQRRTLSGDGRWVKTFWQKEFLGRKTAKEERGIKGFGQSAEENSAQEREDKRTPHDAHEEQVPTSCASKC